MLKRSVPTYDGFTKITGEGNSAKVTIRRPYLQVLNWRKGDTVICRVVDDALVIRKVNQLLEQVSRQMEDRDREAARATSPLPSTV